MHNEDKTCECDSCITFRKIGLKDQSEFVKKFLSPLKEAISKSLSEQKAYVESFNLSQEDYKKVSIACLLTDVQVLAFLVAELEITSGGNIQELMEIILVEFSRATEILNNLQSQPLNDKVVEKKVINTIVQSNMLN